MINTCYNSKKPIIIPIYDDGWQSWRQYDPVSGGRWSNLTLEPVFGLTHSVGQRQAPSQYLTITQITIMLTI